MRRGRLCRVWRVPGRPRWSAQRDPEMYDGTDALLQRWWWRREGETWTGDSETVACSEMHWSRGTRPPGDGQVGRPHWRPRRERGAYRLRLGDGQTAARLSCFRVVCAMNPAGPSSRDSVSKTVAKSCWSTKSRLFFSSWTTDPEPRQGDGEGSVTRVVDAAPVQDVSQSESGEVRRAGRPRQSRWPCRT